MFKLAKFIDPDGIDQHDAGAKLDAGKNQLGLVLGGFSKALIKVGEVGTSGAIKYSPNGWKSVDNAEGRYMDALLRHQMAYLSGEELDPESGQPHLAHMAWNSLALLEFYEEGEVKCLRTK